MSSSPIGLTAPDQLTREHYENRSANKDSHAIDRAGKSECPWEHRALYQKSAVDEDLPRCCGPSGNDRQHGDARTGIFVDAIERQRPKMRRRPQENNEK